MTTPEQPPEPVVDETLTPLEAAFYVLVLRKIAEWLNRIVAAVMAPWRRWGMTPDPSGVWSGNDFWDSSVGEMVGWLSEAAEHGWDRFEDGDRLGPFPSTDAFVQAHLAQVRNYLVRIPDETYNLIFSEITAGVNEGESVEEIAERVDSILHLTGSENWPARARVISITEVNGAANAGWMGAALQLEQLLGTPLSKRWLAADDKATRTTHRQADDQVRLLMEPFIVGGFPLLYPGDKAGPPQEVINCRCAAATEGA